MGAGSDMIVPDGKTHYVLEAEKAFFESYFREDFEKKNARIRKKKGKKYVRTEREYMEAHQPFELIVQLGNVANIESGTLDRAHSLEYLERIRCSLLSSMRDRYGFEAVSYDIHDDEETPHVHIRGHYMIDGEANRNKALNAHGFYAKGGKNTASDNPTVLMTAELRGILERAADQHLRDCGYKYRVNRERLPARRSESVRDFKQIKEKEKEARSELTAVENTLAVKRKILNDIEEREKAVTAREEALTMATKKLKAKSEAVAVREKEAEEATREAVQREAEAKVQRDRYEKAASDLSKFVSFVQSLHSYNGNIISPFFKELLVRLVIEYRHKEEANEDNSCPEQQFDRNSGRDGIEYSVGLQRSLNQKSYDDRCMTL